VHIPEPLKLSESPLWTAFMVRLPAKVAVNVTEQFPDSLNHRGDRFGKE